MVRNVSRGFGLVALALWGGSLSGVGGARVSADPPARNVREFQGTADVRSTGDARVEIRMPLGASFEAQKEALPDPGALVSRLRWPREDYVVAPGATVGYDDADRSIHAVLELRGATRRGRDGRWPLALGASAQHVGTEPGEGGRARVTATEERAYPEGLAYRGRWTLQLPAGASDVRWDATAHALTWALPVARGQGAGLLEVDLQVPERLMTCCYKVYALGAAMPEHWVARAVVRNTGAGTLEDVEIRYRLAGYSEWSPWSRYPVLAPGQTLVDLLYPVLDASVAKLRSPTPANVLAEWAWTGSDGKRYTSDGAQKTTLLGVNDVMPQRLAGKDLLGGWASMTANCPLIAAWVTRNDPVLKEFAALANKNAGGVMADGDDATALTVMRHCYELMLRNDITYQGATGVMNKAGSFDDRLVQAVRFPREVLRDRSGTCIELAVAYAAMIQVLGLKPFLVWIPGHCFPVVELPKSGTLKGVESTMLRGAQNGDFDTFDDALATGTEGLAKALLSGDFHLIDLQDLWGRGVSNPELEDLPADSLKTWGVTAEGKGMPNRTAAPGGPEAPEAPEAFYDVKGTLRLGPLEELGLSFEVEGTCAVAPTGDAMLKLTSSGDIAVQARLLGASLAEGRGATLQALWKGRWDPRRRRAHLRCDHVTVTGDPGGKPERMDLVGEDVLVTFEAGTWSLRRGSEEHGWIALPLTLKRKP